VRRADNLVAVVDCIDPDAYGTGAVNGDIIDMADFEQVMFIVQVGDMVSTGTVNFQVYQGNTSALGSSKVITGAAITQLTQAGADDNKQAIVVVKRADLDVANGFRWVRGTLTLTTAGADSGVVSLGFYPRFGPASDYDLASVDEIVAL
jgi:hypothetical protein